MIDDVVEWLKFVTRSKKAFLVALEACRAVLEWGPLVRHRLPGRAKVCIFLAVRSQEYSPGSRLIGEIKTHLDHCTGIMIGPLDLLDIVQAERDLPSWGLRKNETVSVAKEGYTWTVVRRFRLRPASDGCEALLLRDGIQGCAISITKLNRIDEVRGRYIPAVLVVLLDWSWNAGRDVDEFGLCEEAVESAHVLISC